MKEILEFEDLKSYIISTHNGRIASGGSQCTMRCPYCGDSRDLRNQHMYIGINKKANNSICFNCFLCNESGLVSLKFFRDIGCYDTNLINEVLDYNNSCFKRNNYARPQFKQNKYFSIISNNVNQNESFEKLSYINNRLGINLSIEDLSKLKIILNLSEYLYTNHIETITRQPQIVDELSKKCIGFLSVDNSHIIMRSIVDYKTLSKPISRRYNNYTIFNAQNDYSYYIIPGNVNINYPITVYMTEGVFDILSVYFNIVQNKNNCIFCASCGKTQFCELLEYLFTVIAIPPQLVSIQLYSDNDMNMKEFNKLKYQTSIIGIPMTIHRNTMAGEKDFGVPKDRIIDSIIQL